MSTAAVLFPIIRLFALASLSTSTLASLLTSFFATLVARWFTLDEGPEVLFRCGVDGGSHPVMSKEFDGLQSLRALFSE